MKSRLYLYAATLTAMCLGAPAFLRLVGAHVEQLGRTGQVLCLAGYGFGALCAFACAASEADLLFRDSTKR